MDYPLCPEDAAAHTQWAARFQKNKTHVIANMDETDFMITVLLETRILSADEGLFTHERQCATAQFVTNEEL